MPERASYNFLYATHGLDHAPLALNISSNFALVDVDSDDGRPLDHTFLII